MTSHEDVATAFAQGHSRTAGHMYTDGKVCYSYGSHFPISAWVPDKNMALFNTDRYSNSTAKHVSEVRAALRQNNVEIIECNTNEIKRYLDTGLIRITLKPKDYTLDQAFEILKLACKKQGMKRFPEKQLRDMIQTKIFTDKL